MYCYACDGSEHACRGRAIWMRLRRGLPAPRSIEPRFLWTGVSRARCSDAVDRSIFYTAPFPRRARFHRCRIDALARYRGGICFFDVGANSGSTRCSRAVTGVSRCTRSNHPNI